MGHLVRDSALVPQGFVVDSIESNDAIARILPGCRKGLAASSTGRRPLAPMENASRAFLDAVRKSMRQIRKALGATCINPGLLSLVI